MLNNKKKKRGVSAAAVGAAGVAAGAGLAIAATKALQNKKVKAKATKFAKDARKTADMYLAKAKALKLAKKADKKMSTQETTPLTKEQLNYLWQIEPEDYFKQRLDVLVHVVKADTGKKYLQHVPGLNPKRRSGPGILPSNPNIGLQPDVLFKLKRRAEFSLRQDFASLGKAQVADAFIIKEENR